jgi:hypothetical protein
MCLNEMCSRVRIGKHSIKQGEVSTPLLFNFSLEYAISKVQDNKARLKLNVTHQLFAYADDVIFPRYNTDTINISTETLIGASKEDGLEVIREKILVYVAVLLPDSRAEL